MIIRTNAIQSIAGKMDTSIKKITTHTWINNLPNDTTQHTHSHMPRGIAQNFKKGNNPPSVQIAMKLIEKVKHMTKMQSE